MFFFTESLFVQLLQGFCKTVSVNTLLSTYKVMDRLQIAHVLLSEFNLWISDDFRGNRSSVIRLNSLNVRSEIWRRSLSCPAKKVQESSTGAAFGNIIIRPGQEKCGIALTRARMGHIENTRVVCCTPQSLYRLFPHLPMIHSFSSIQVMIMIMKLQMKPA